MAKIEDSIGYVLVNEGGYVNNPKDPGGPTNWGITIPALAQYRHVDAKKLNSSDMKNLTKLEATEVYRVQYWIPMRLDSVISSPIATCIFDIGVNRGPSVGIKYAQKTCNVLSAINPVTPDGKMGQLTLAAINGSDVARFIRTIEALDVAGYEAIIAHNPTMEVFRHGWMARAKRLLTLIPN